MNRNIKNHNIVWVMRWLGTDVPGMVALCPEEGDGEAKMDCHLIDWL